MPYIIAPLNLVKGENNYSEYNDVLKAVQDKAVDRAKEIWNGYSQGGLTPGDKEFGIGPHRMNEMASDVTATTLSGSYTFRKAYTAGAWRPIFSYTTRKDIMHAFAGFQFTDETLLFSQIRFEVGDRIFPILDIQQAHAYPSFSLVLKEDSGKELIADPETRVLVRGYCETTGTQRIVPLGFQLFKRKDLVITET